jgi:hypothetical protein
VRGCGPSVEHNPSPGSHLRCDPTSPTGRGEVSAPAYRPIQLEFTPLQLSKLCAEEFCLPLSTLGQGWVLCRRRFRCSITPALYDREECKSKRDRVGGGDFGYSAGCRVVQYQGRPIGTAIRGEINSPSGELIRCNEMFREVERRVENLTSRHPTRHSFRNCPNKCQPGLTNGSIVNLVSQAPLLRRRCSFCDTFALSHSTENYFLTSGHVLSASGRKAFSPAIVSITL